MAGWRIAWKLNDLLRDTQDGSLPRAASSDWYVAMLQVIPSQWRVDPSRGMLRADSPDAQTPDIDRMAVDGGRMAILRQTELLWRLICNGRRTVLVLLVSLLILAEVSMSSMAVDKPGAGTDAPGSASQKGVGLRLGPRPQAPARRRADFTPEAVIGTNPRVPFTVCKRTKLIFVEVGIAGKTASFLFDTGAHLTVITPEAVKRLGIVQVRIPIPTPDHPTRKTLDALPIESLKLADITFTDYDVIELDLSHLTKSIKSRVDGILGSNSFGVLPYTINYRERYIEFGLPDSARKLNWSMVEVDKHRPVLEAFIDGQSVDFLLDSGASRSFIDKRKYAGKMEKRKGDVQTDILNSKQTKHNTHAVPEKMTVVGLPIEGIHPQICDHRSLLGVDLLQRCIITVDIPHRRVCLRKYPEPATQEAEPAGDSPKAK